ncbi:uncharacterized protein H6S33_010489 [Morchella sextelata]|uniref:uncharacterized protein n=1 Tax=Morchella sextelata TaxID=1174677 RepID=UPI001D049862|nr:uncharacterized protein H6S33_010489 [Morchella sextelata]KAH0612437.1 hypothetical protein H6S33_010489 [Morchella sextelata]
MIFRPTPLLRAIRLQAKPTSLTSRIQCRNLNFWGRKGMKEDDAVITAKGLGDKILVYYAGQRIVFVATLKLATLFVAGFCTFIAAPSVGVETDYGYWAPVGIIIAGTIPIAFMQYTSPPYVTHAYLHLPPWARVSREMVARYVKKLPPSAEISLGTIRTLGRPQLNKVILSELRFKPKRLGCSNWEWKPPFEDKKVYRDFFVDQRGSPAKVPMPGIMDEIMKLVREQTALEKK